MKFNYTKPAIAFQNIALATDISPGCKFKVNFNFGTCAIEIPEWDGDTIYVSRPNCKYTFDRYPCYDVPTESSAIVDS